MSIRKTEIEMFLDEYNQEFDNVIKPLDIIEMSKGIHLYYKQIFDIEIEHLNKFCKIYNLRLELINVHNCFYYHIY